MKIAQIHNRYIERGGEDIVVEREYELLSKGGHQVVQYLVSNSDVRSTTQKLKMAFSMPFSKEQYDRIIKFLKQEQPDVVHVHNFLPVITPAVFYACESEAIPVVQTLHNFRLLCVNGLLYRDGKVCEKCVSKKLPLSGIRHGCYQDSSVKSIFPAITNGIHNYKGTWSSKIDKLIFLTEFSKSVFDRSAIDLLERKTTIKPNFVADRGYEIEKHDYYLFVGRFSEEKGIHTIIEAFKSNGRKLVLAGSGPLEGYLRNVAKEYLNIEVKGFLSQDELGGILKYAKALLFSSSIYEGMPLVIVEAFSMGTPVIAADFGNGGQMISRGQNGLKFALGDAESLNRTLQEYEKTPTVNYASLARSTYEMHYSEEKNLKMLTAIYKDVISQKKQTSSC